MAKTIASTYEVLEHIGAGGGGNVYLAQHLRLNKKVVLKADKRKLTTRPELLRREVDVLKNLSHPYIPKVYDFFTEDDIVYTAMDYIEGESLDKPLKRGERFSQPQVIEWAVQLLEALKYLHSPIHGDPPRGFVHSDIKPANLMRTPFNNICLIDFNISLALGEENFVGYSAGYASPEHYGLDYSIGLNDKGTTSRSTNSRTTSSRNTSNKPYDPNAATRYMGTDSPSESGKKTVVPDVRSDIYSTGAVMYHLLSGKRPASSALEVEPLSEQEFSPQLIAIIQKAMQPNPDLRYQSAEEMLYALTHLRENDPRVKRSKRLLAVSEICMGVLLAAGVCSAFVGLKRIQATETSLKLAEYSHSAMEQGNAALAVDYALQAYPGEGGIFGPSYSPQAEYALSSALNVYDLSDSFKPYKTLELDSAALGMKISPDGSRFVCMRSGEAVVCDCETAEVIARLPADISALSQAEFLRDDAIVFAGEGAIQAYDISTGETLWTGEPATAVSVSADGGTVAAVWRDNDYAVVYDAASGEQIARVDFSGRTQSVKTNDRFVNPNDNLLALNRTGTLLAVSFSDGTLSVFSIGEECEELPIFAEPMPFFHYEGGFSRQYLAFSGANEEGSAFAVIDCDRWEQTGGFQSESFYSVNADENGILVQTDNLLVQIDPETGDNVALVDTAEKIRAYAWDGERAVISTNSGLGFFAEGMPLSELSSREPLGILAIGGEYALAASTDQNTVRIMRYENHPDSELFSYDPYYPHDEARISADGQYLMLFKYDAFRIYDKNGNILCDAEIPDADQVYDQQYIRENGGSELQVIYYSGRTLVYSGADGSLLREEQREKPDPSLMEEFLTDTLRIESPLHGAPTAYSLSDGRQVAQLEQDAYLTYVTQLDENIIAQYITTEGEFFGILMNDKCEVLAKLPNLCDIHDGNAVFDYPTGNIRYERIYKSNELITIARNKEGESKQ